MRPINILLTGFVTAFIIMLFIYLIKKASAKWNIPIVSAVAAEV